MERVEHMDPHEKQPSPTSKGGSASLQSLSITTGSKKAHPPEDKHEEPPQSAKSEEVTTANATAAPKRHSPRSSSHSRRHQHQHEQHSQTHKQEQQPSMPQASTSAIVVDGASNAQRGSSRDVRPNSRQQDTPVSLAMRITAAVIVVLIVINVLVFAYASIVSAAEPPLRELTDPPGGNPIYNIPAKVFNVTTPGGDV